MRVIGLTAAGLLAAGALAFATSGHGAEASAAVDHTCSATDKQFIREAKTNMLMVGKSGRDYLTGNGPAKYVLEDTARAEVLVRRTRPTDPSLEKTRIVMATMFKAYGTAVKARAKRRDAGRHMYRAYGLANLARDILVDAEPGLRRVGCDITGLL